jgi:hypothetical protein
MDETVTSSGSPAEEPVINVIEPDPPPLPDPQGGTASSGRFDQTATDALAARRRREFDAARARLRDQAIRADEPSRAGEQQPAKPQNPARGSEDVPAQHWAPLGSPPEKVRKRYLRAGNQYFLKDTPHQLAFEDIGPYLVTEHNRSDVVESMVDMVRAKDWGRIRVSGHPQFRQEVWVQATLLGIEVSGYEPKPVDFARLAEGRRDRLTNRIEVTGPAAAAQASAASTKAPPTAPGPMQASGGKPATSVDVRQPEPGPGVPVASPAAPAPAAPLRQAAAPDVEPPVADAEGHERQRYAGELVEHGGAPYQHNPARSDSYYVVYRDAGGADHVVWGVDLERAVAESGALAGQQVVLENLGRRLVTVTVPVVDATGTVIGEEEKDVYRNTWQVDVAGQERTQPRAAAPERERERERSEEHRASTPEQAQALRRRKPSVVPPEERAVQMAVLTAAMRQHGLSERSIALVQQHAQRLMGAFEAEGVTVPRPRVFDPEAPSDRSRRIRAAPDRAQSREVERAPSEPAPPSL